MDERISCFLTHPRSFPYIPPARMRHASERVCAIVVQCSFSTFINHGSTSIYTRWETCITLWLTNRQNLLVPNLLTHCTLTIARLQTRNETHVYKLTYAAVNSVQKTSEVSKKKAICCFCFRSTRRPYTPTLIMVTWWNLQKIDPSRMTGRYDHSPFIPMRQKCVFEKILIQIEHTQSTHWPCYTVIPGPNPLTMLYSYSPMYTSATRPLRSITNHQTNSLAWLTNVNWPQKETYHLFKRS